MVLGFVTATDLQQLREELSKETDTKLRRLPRQGDSAQEALRKLLEQVNPREFVESALLSKGLTIEVLVKQGVQEVLRSKAPEFISEALTDKVYDDVDMDRVYDEVAERVTKHLLGEGKAELLGQIAEKVADNVWDGFDFDDFYPIVGEKIVDKIGKEKTG